MKDSLSKNAWLKFVCSPTCTNECTSKEGRENLDSVDVGLSNDNCSKTENCHRMEIHISLVMLLARQLPKSMEDVHFANDVPG